MLDGTEYFECTCGSVTHTLRFVVDKGDETWPPTMYVELMMSHYLPWYKRVWVSIKYIFKMDTPDHYGCWELNIKDTKRLVSMLKSLETDNFKFQVQNPKKKVRAGWINEGLYGGYEQEDRD